MVKYIIEFFIELSRQIQKIKPPKMYDFITKSIGVIGVTVFFSFFFYVLSHFWVKFIIYIYGIGE